MFRLLFLPLIYTSVHPCMCLPEILYLILRIGLHALIMAPAWKTNGRNNGIGAKFESFLIFIIGNGLHALIMVPALMADVGANILPLWAQTYYIQVPQFWTGQILQLLLYSIFINWRNGLYAPIVAPPWKTDQRNNGIGAHLSFRQALQFSTAQILLLLLYLIFITWRNGLHAQQLWTGWILWLLLYLIFIIWRNGLVAPAWKTDWHNSGIGAHLSFKQALQFWTAQIWLLLLYLIFITCRNGLHAPQFWTSQILWLLLYLIFIIWRNGLYVLIVAPAWKTNGCNSGISAHLSFRQAPQFWRAQILLLLLYISFITWRNGLHAPQFWTGWILWLLRYLIFIIWTNGLYALLGVPTWKNDECNNGISTHPSFRQAPHFLRGQILLLLLYLNFITWRNGLHAPQFWTGWILWLLPYIVFIIWTNGLVAPAWKTDGCNNGIGAHPSFRQAPQFWTGQILLLLLYLNFITWRNGLHAPQFWTGWILCLLFIWWWVQNIISYWHTARRLMGAVDGRHNPVKVGQSIPNGALFVAAHPCRMAKFRVLAQLLPMANSWKLSPFCWPTVDRWLSHSAGPSVMDPFDCPNWSFCSAEDAACAQWEDQCTWKGGSMRRMDWTGAWTTPKQHTHTHFQNLNTLSPTICARCFEFRVLKVLRNTQMFYLVELTLLTCLRIFVYKIASGSPKAWVWVC